MSPCLPIRSLPTRQRWISAPSHTVLAAGLRVGPYEIVAPLGAGGMGEVYRAHDIRLGRDVAIKTLPDQFARNRERVSRLRREARTLASLNHPHVAAIYGLEEFDGTDFLVLELVEGRASGGATANCRGADESASRSQRLSQPLTHEALSTATSSPRT